MIINHILPTRTIPAEVLPFTIQGPEQIFVMAVIVVTVAVGLLAIAFGKTD